MRYWGELKHVGRYLYSILVLGKGKSLSPKRICCFPLHSQTRWHALVPLCPLLMITLQGWLPPEPVRWQISGVFWTGPITMPLYLLRRGQSNSCLVELCSWKFLRSSPEQMTLWMCTWLVIVAERGVYVVLNKCQSATHSISGCPWAAAAAEEILALHSVDWVWKKQRRV